MSISPRSQRKLRTMILYPWLRRYRAATFSPRSPRASRFLGWTGFSPLFPVNRFCSHSNISLARISTPTPEASRGARVIIRRSMIRALALETSGKIGSVAAVVDGAVVAEEQFAHGLQHAAQIV